MRSIIQEVYIYPAIFTKEADNGYSVVFPDLKGCVTEGDSLNEAMEMASDALGLYISTLIDNNELIPEPSDPTEVRFSNGSFVTLIQVNLLDYNRKHFNKFVKKTLSIPQWLNAAAEKESINFSQVLKEALKDRLHIDD